MMVGGEKSNRGNGEKAKPGEVVVVAVAGIHGAYG
jgi:hypothetical protein